LICCFVVLICLFYVVLRFVVDLLFVVCCYVVLITLWLLICFVGWLRWFTFVLDLLVVALLFVG